MTITEKLEVGAFGAILIFALPAIMIAAHLLGA
jgi:hypothetical protein